MSIIESHAARAAATVVRSGEGRTVRWRPRGTIRIVAGTDTTDKSFSIVESVEPNTARGSAIIT